MRAIHTALVLQPLASRVREKRIEYYRLPDYRVSRGGAAILVSTASAGNASRSNRDRGTGVVCSVTPVLPQAVGWTEPYRSNRKEPIAGFEYTCTVREKKNCTDLGIVIK